MNIKLIGAIVVVLVGALVLCGRKIASKLQEGIVKRYAMKAVLGAEMMVSLAGEEKFKIALQWAMVQLLSRWKIPISPERMASWINWAVSKMKADGKEIKAENVLNKDGLRLKLERGNYMLQGSKSF